MEQTARPPDPPPSTTHDPRLHRQFAVPTETSEQHYLAKPDELKPQNHHQPPPLFVRMLWVMAVSVAALGYFVMLFGVWVWISNDEFLRGVIISCGGYFVILTSAILGSMYHATVASLARTRMMSQLIAHAEDDDEGITQAADRIHSGTDR